MIQKNTSSEIPAADIFCPECGSDNFKKNGTFKKKKYGDIFIPRYLCKDCGKSFSVFEKGFDKKDKKETLKTLFRFGFSMREIANVIGVSQPTISNWSKTILEPGDYGKNAMAKRTITDEEKEKIKQAF